MKLFIRSQDTAITDLDSLPPFLESNNLDGVQLVAYKTFPSMFAYEKGSLDKDKCGKVFKSLGGKIPLIGAYFNPVHSNIEKVQRGVDVFKEYLTFAKDLGGCYVGSETGSFNDDKWTYNPKNRTDEALQTVIETFDKLDKFAQRKGAAVAVEGAAGHVCYDVRTLNRLKTAIGSKSLKIIFDLYNFLDSSNYNSYLDILDEGLETFGNDILLFHIKDCTFAGGAVMQVPVKEGQLDFKAILSRIKKHDKNANLVLEGTLNPYIKSASEFLRKIWGSV